MTREDQIAYLKTNNFFDAARANDDEHPIPFKDTASIIDSFEWYADGNHNWSAILSEICHKYNLYSPEDILEAY